MKLRNWLVGCSICLIFGFMATSVHAQGLYGGSPYLSVHVGATWLDDADNDFKGFPLTFKSEYDTGYTVGAAAGYDFNMWRAEFEIAYRQNDVDKIKIPGETFNGGGDTSALSFMVNGYFDIHNQSAFTPYLGAGIGLARVSANDWKAEGEKIVDDSDTVFAYQLGAGVGWEFMPNLTLDLGYRYFATADPEFRDVDGDKFESEYKSHNLMLGLRIGF
ncbi:outer membrane protein [Geoalkalibacter halelectricus]|uniref:Porin family protein n=1 Tax=Geoalkalibacter halelectricus TaxID=2847045 RepID=A0ABY5ZJ89_9BACT|nr:outer membrane protein [Geoalkalibacter halelectricus]MDO3377331.1 porin family protein [Geoalkalibacter halelectricus]UWZ79202.1 porin family protein [Geoalkalibacter halelectricus]